MEIIVLVCALGVAASDCRSETSFRSFKAPEPAMTLVGCLRDGTLYAAQSGMVPEGTYAKIVCGAGGTPATLMTDRR
jgi:hypothetical protein